MRGFLPLVLVSIALLQTAAAVPTVSERSQAVEARDGEQNLEKRNNKISIYWPPYRAKDNENEDEDED
ncbi:hypothetical protein BDR03DRAFT_954733 [Suillus americanus]|nr:hypothetical protein BDR03DRAFT_954733 [Suillus americanus]